MLKRKHKNILKLILLGIVIFFFIPLINIYWYNEPDFIDSKNPKDYAIVFGAAIRSQNRLSQVLESRMDDAIELYHEKKVSYLVLSGAKYGQIEPGEPKAMEYYATTHKVKKKDIILDERGERTYLTVQFTNNLYKMNPKAEFVFITSAYHMFRVRLLVMMSDIPKEQVFFYFKSTTIPFYRKEIIREVFAFWFYSLYKLTYFFTGKN